MEAFLGAFWRAVLVSGALAYPIFKLLLAMKARQTISKHLGESHQAKQGTPTMGGLIILPGLVYATWTGNWAVTVCILSFAAIGFIDDFVVPRLMPGKRGLGWTQKLLMQILSTAAVVQLGWPEGDWIQKGIVGFMILFMANAYNFADGLDALAGGLISLLSLGLLGAAYLLGVGADVLVPVAGALLGATIPFQFLNAPPAKVFMGDVGSLPIGAVLGYCFGVLCSTTWTGYSLTYLWIAWICLGFVMIAELVPVPVQILSVKVFKKRLPIRTPIHHTFEHKGWPESRILFVFLLVQALGVAASMTWILTARSNP
ncbi:MAG: hypothetical protein KF784_06660 [Fimbriimonadaceae bacterium]|nr:hypothetical protein [Fimbriimonadaceae bacterium]